MSSNLIAYLFQEELEEKEAEKEAALRQAWQQAVADVLVARFPQTSEAAVGTIRRITDLTRLQRLVGTIVQAPDSEAAVRLLDEAYARERTPRQ